MGFAWMHHISENKEFHLRNLRIIFCSPRGERPLNPNILQEHTQRISNVAGSYDQGNAILGIYYTVKLTTFINTYVWLLVEELHAIRTKAPLSGKVHLIFARSVTHKGLNGWVCSPSASIKKDYWQTHSDVGYVISIWSNQSLIDNGIDWQWHGRLFIDCYWNICSTVNPCFNEIVLVFTGLLLCRTTWFIDFVCWAVTGCVGKKRETISGKAS